MFIYIYSPILSEITIPAIKPINNISISPMKHYHQVK